MCDSLLLQRKPSHSWADDACVMSRQPPYLSQNRENTERCGCGVWRQLLKSSCVLPPNFILPPSPTPLCAPSSSHHLSSRPLCLSSGALIHAFIQVRQDEKTLKVVAEKSHLKISRAGKSHLVIAGFILNKQTVSN